MGKVVQKTKKILQEANLPPNAVPPRIFIPILEASSLENDDTLQDLWGWVARERFRKSDSQSPSFVETLKQLTPVHAKALDRLFSYSWKREASTIGIWDTSSLGTPIEIHSMILYDLDEVSFQLLIETLERLGLIRKQYDLKKPYEAFLFGGYSERSLPER